MPLLKRKAFEKSTVSEYLRDDDEVFHCEITDEIFKDYEEYCERIILVNSMVWTCEMTGKNNLTYSEALDSEKAARRSLRDFPMELRIPILYLATKTKRSSFAEMSEDVFNYVRERYFVGETIEACLEGDIWMEGHILSVTAQKQHPDNKTMPTASAYCYEVEQFDESDAATTGQIGTAPYDRVRRRKGIYTRDKNRLFLKQFVTPGNIIGIKQSAIEKYNIAKVHFDQIFTGSPPVFPSSKKLLKTSMSPGSKPGSATKLKSAKKPSPDKKGRQESMDKFIKKTEKSDVKPKAPMDPEARKQAQDLVEKMRRAEDQMRQRKEDEKAKKKEKNAKLMAFMKEWQKVKDDQELEDHKIIPKGTPVQMEGIPHNNFGDFLSVLEFVHNFADILKLKDVFHNELDVETFRKSLTTKENAWIFSEIIQMFLSAIFSLQEDEAEEYNESGGILESVDEELDSDVGTSKAIELATKASKWSKTYLGTPLSKLHLDPTTVSEVLRLHLLSSGGAAAARAVAWRAHQRGGYGSADDPAIRLRRAHPEVLRRLHRGHLADMPLDDKFLVLQCLMNQVLSYANVRDQVEEKIDEHKNLKQALRMLQINERKREPQLATARAELRKEYATKKEELKLTGDKAVALEAELQQALENLKEENEEKKVEYEKKLKDLQSQLFDYTTYLGSDRAFRRYWVSHRVPGVFVEAGAEPRGPCRRKPLPPPPAPRADLLAYLADLADLAGSDKENESAANSRGNSPKKPLTNLNGLTTKMNGVDAATQHMRDLLICTADINTCYVHGKGEYRPQWWVYHSAEQLTALTAALNRRGLREAELRAALEVEQAQLADFADKCPLHQLNPDAAAALPPAAHAHGTRQRRVQPSLTVPADCSLSEALELSVRDLILDLEEKIFHGCLGALKVKDREAWRGTIMLRGYDKQADFLRWGPGQGFRDDWHQPRGVLQLPADIDKSEIDNVPENKYRDPGHYLDAGSGAAGGEPDGPAAPDELAAHDTPGADPAVVRALACALLQVAQSIHHKYLKRPLGLDDKERKEREARNRSLEPEALARWEVSLLESRSWAALALHALALDGSVRWAASVLRAACRVCRRRQRPGAMLLCDGCNRGHHLYCLKPELTKVPSGDWFCDQCKPKERTPRKRRKLYTEESSTEAVDESSSDEFSVDAVCVACRSGGKLAAECRDCGGRYHAECAVPAPARAARRWVCAACRPTTAPREQAARRRCGALAISTIRQYVRAVSRRTLSSDSEDSDFNTALVKLKVRKSRSSKDSSPLRNGTPEGGVKRGRKPKGDMNGNTKRKSKSLTNGTHEAPALQPDALQQLQPDALQQLQPDALQQLQPDALQQLQPDALQQLLRDALRHRDSWPFSDPVDVNEVPDYLQVIEQPMDLSTISGKLEAGEYGADAELLADVALVFNNCYTYNKDTHPVARAGCRLERYIIKRCSELKLPPLPETILEAEDTATKRGPQDDDEDAPLQKRPKLK